MSKEDFFWVPWLLTAISFFYLVRKDILGDTKSQQTAQKQAVEDLRLRTTALETARLLDNLEHKNGMELLKLEVNNSLQQVKTASYLIKKALGDE